MSAITIEDCLTAAACAGNINECRHAILCGARDFDGLLHIALLRGDDKMRDLALSYGAVNRANLAASTEHARAINELSDAQWMLYTAQELGHVEVAEYARYLMETC